MDLRTAIRPASLSDVPAILVLEKNVADAAHWSREQYEARLKRGCLLLAESNSVVVGFICARVLPGEWEIENIAVGNEFRRRGIANALLNALFEAAKKAGSPAFHLEVRESNLAARQLYTKHGFFQVGQRPNYYRDPPEDAILYLRGAAP
jgi:[ribosomal protein S18]-alanine N-acetyltransferase